MVGGHCGVLLTPAPAARAADLAVRAMPIYRAVDLYIQLASKLYLLIHESPLTDALFLLVSKSDEVTTT